MVTDPDTRGQHRTAFADADIQAPHSMRVTMSSVLCGFSTARVQAVVGRSVKLVAVIVLVPFPWADVGAAR
jgi:hypothetical protein